MQPIEGTVLITGAARGIGQATAVELAHRGCDILGVDLPAAGMEETAAKVRGAGRSFTAFACNICDDNAVLNLLNEAMAQTAGFDILVNNAGVLPSGPYAEGNFADWRRTVEVNLIGTMRLTHAALPHLLRKQRSHIVNIASIAGKLGSEGVVAYAASKHGVAGFSSALRAELAGSGVRVSCIYPSHVRTRLTDGVPHTFWTPLVSPERVARAVCKTITGNAVEIYVPAHMRWLVSVLPAVAPGLARWILRKSRASQGWLLVKKKLQV